MYYNYKCGNKVIEVWKTNNGFDDTVSVVIDRREYVRSIRKDKNGEFFTWDRNKIYIDDWIRFPMKDFLEKIKNNEWVSTSELCLAIMSHGIDNIKFMVPFEVSCNSIFFRNKKKEKHILCKIEERWNREVNQNYKIVLVPVHSYNKYIGNKDLYTEYLLGFIKEGRIKIILD